MRLDSGNRSFLALLVTGRALYLALAAAACAMFSLLIYRLASDGSAAFDDQPWVIAPAGAFLLINTIVGVMGCDRSARRSRHRGRLRRRGISRH